MVSLLRKFDFLLINKLRVIKNINERLRAR